MSNSDSRWLHSFLVFSSGIADQFLEDLWLHVLDHSKLMEISRSALAGLGAYPLSGQDSLWVQRKRDDISSALGERAAAYLECWTRDVLFVNGQDRVQEGLWQSLLFQAPGIDDFQAKHLQGFVKDLGDVRRSEVRELKRRISIVTSVSEESLKAGRSLFGTLSIDDFKEEIELTSNMNGFVRTWEKASSQLVDTDLAELLEWGMKNAPLLGMEPDSLQPPGSWNFALGPTREIARLLSPS